MPINQDKIETTKSPTSTPTSTTGQDKPTAGMEASNDKPGAPTSVPGRMEHDKSGTQPDVARTPDATTPADSNRDQKFGQPLESPNKGH